MRSEKFSSWEGVQWRIVQGNIATAEILRVIFLFDNMKVAKCISNKKVSIFPGIFVGPF